MKGADPEVQLDVDNEANHSQAAKLPLSAHRLVRIGLNGSSGVLLPLLLYFFRGFTSLPPEEPHLGCCRLNRGGETWGWVSNLSRLLSAKCGGPVSHCSR